MENETKEAILNIVKTLEHLSAALDAEKDKLRTIIGDKRSKVQNVRVQYTGQNFDELCSIFPYKFGDAGFRTWREIHLPSGLGVLCHYPIGHKSDIIFTGEWLYYERDGYVRHCPAFYDAICYDGTNFDQIRERFPEMVFRKCEAMPHIPGNEWGPEYLCFWERPDCERRDVIAIGEWLIEDPDNSKKCTRDYMVIPKHEFDLELM